MILSNQIRCLKCGDTPYSRHVHDFAQCECGAVFVDGGTQYRRIGGEAVDYEDMAITWEDERYRRMHQMLEDLWKDAQKPTVSSVVQVYLDVQDEAGDIPVEAVTQAAEWALESNRNTYGLICAMARAERDGEFKQGAK